MGKARGRGRVCTVTGRTQYNTKDAALRAARKVAGERGCANPGVEPHDGHWHLGPIGDPAPHLSTAYPGERNRFTVADWDEATLLLWHRCRDRCEWCREPLGGQMVRHHRQRRAIGGDRLSNLVALHDVCHKHVHAHPSAALYAGFIVSSYEADPALVPIRLEGESLWLLKDDGRKFPIP